MKKDHLSLIAAVFGGFMLSVAATGIIKAAPIVSMSASSLTTPAPNLSTSTSVRFEKRS